MSVPPRTLPLMGGTRRYVEQVNRRQDASIAAGDEYPLSVPMQAYGPVPLEWARGSREPVWVWVQYPTRPAERIAANAHGWNDRVVVVTWPAVGGERQVVVWRNAVTRRDNEERPSH